MDLSLFIQQTFTEHLLCARNYFWVLRIQCWACYMWLVLKWLILEEETINKQKNDIATLIGTSNLNLYSWAPDGSLQKNPRSNPNHPHLSDCSHASSCIVLDSSLSSQPTTFRKLLVPSSHFMNIKTLQEEFKLSQKNLFFFHSQNT